MNRHPLAGTLVLACVYAFGLSSCGVGSVHSRMAHPAAFTLESPAVRFSSLGSDSHPYTAVMISLGSNLALTPRHAIHHPVIFIDGKASGLDVVTIDPGDHLVNDWMIVRINDFKLDRTALLGSSSELLPGDKIVICGIEREPFEGEIVHPCSLPERTDGALHYKIDGCPNLAGYSGSPLMRRNSSGDWEVIGMHIAVFTGIPLIGTPTYIGVPITRITGAMHAIN